MTGNPEKAILCGTGLSWFFLQRLPPLLDAFEQEIDGIRDARDIENIHRMRVASRRLRAALPLFRGCFPQKHYSRWMAAIAAVTRALGEARDADVQILFLEKYRKKNNGTRAARQSGRVPGPNPLEPALTYLLQERKEQRQRVQAGVISTLDILEKSGTIREMRTLFAERSALISRTPVRSLALGIPTIAAFRIAARLDSFRSFEPWVIHPDAVAEHHSMRIAAKKLRYTMEIYSPLYRRGLHKPHDRVKKVQEILGDLHDCDVWIDHVTRLLLRERGRLRSGDRRPDTATLSSLRLFLNDREKARIRIHRRFMRYWQALDNAKIWDEILMTLESGRKNRFTPGMTGIDAEMIVAAGTAAATGRENRSHQQTVTRLSLMLFDSLTSLHNLRSHDRCLLECAGMLHDIGPVPGAKQHAVRSAMQIFSNETLPLDMTDRSIIGLIVLTHRGKVRTKSHPLFRLLPPDRQDAVLRLAALLRIADRLDQFYTGAVQEVRCTIEEEGIFCDVVASGDASSEKMQARSRSGLFVRVFGRPLVIR